MRATLILAGALAALAAATSAQAADAHYDIKAALDLKSGAEKAEVTITVPPEQVGHEISFILADAIKLDHVDGGPGAQVHVAPTDQPFKGLNLISFDFAQTPTRPVVLHFSLHGSFRPVGEKPLVDPVDGVEVGFEDAWVPVSQHFNLLFTVDADIRGIPANEVAVAQGQIRHVGDHLIIHRNFIDMDMPFAAMTGLKKSVEPDVEVYARHPDGVLETSYRKNATKVLAYYFKLFGPLPDNALPARLVVMQRGGAAYERRAYISVGDGTEELKKIGHVEDWMLTGTISHELAHGWWWHGDPLTENNWLNESFAEYSSLRYTEATYGADALKTRLDKKVDLAKKAGPMIGAGRPSKYASYDKGPLLLFELDHKIGRAKMDQFLGVIGRHPPHTTEELLKVLSDVAGPQVAHDFEAELRAP